VAQKAIDAEARHFCAGCHDAEQRGNAQAAEAAEAAAGAQGEAVGAEQRGAKRGEASASSAATQKPPKPPKRQPTRETKARVLSSAAPSEARRALRRLAWPLAAVIAVRVRVLSRQRRACVRLNGRATDWRIRMQRHRRGWMAFHLHVVGRVDEPCCGYPKATGSGLFLEAVPVVAGTTLGSGGTTRWCACAENGVIEAVPSARAHAGSFCGNLAQLGSTGRLAGLPWPSPRSWPAPGAAAKQQAGANASAIGRPSEYYRLPVSERLGLPEARRIVAPRAARCTKFGNLVGL
jgi:hypothetical protein